MKILVEFKTTRPIPEITDIIAGRVYTIEGVDIRADVTATLIESDKLLGGLDELEAREPIV